MTAMAQEMGNKPYIVPVVLTNPDGSDWLATAKTTSAEGIFAWGATPDAAVNELGKLVLDWANGGASPYKNKTFTSVVTNVMWQHVVTAPAGDTPPA